MKQGIKYQRIFILCLLSISVLTLILFFSTRFSDSLGQKDFIDDLASLKYRTDSLQLNVIQQEKGEDVKEPTLVVYKDENIRSVVVSDNARGDTGANLLDRNGTNKDISHSVGKKVCDPNSRWYIADGGSCPGDLLLLTGKALSHATAGLRPAASYRSTAELSTGTSGRTSLAFRLMPQSNAILDCSPIAAAGHIIPHSYVPVSVSQFMDDLSAEEDMAFNRLDSPYEPKSNIDQEPSLRSILSDPLSGLFLEDAMVVSCGHSFGGLMLRKVIESSRCSICNSEIVSGSLVPNLALRAAAAAVKYEDDRRLFHNAALRKRRKEMGEHMFTMKRLNRENGDVAIESDNSVHNRGVQYPFSVNEKVLIKGNRRTPEKFVGSEAVITSQCLNGWYLLKILGSGESVRLKYRSLRKIISSQVTDDRVAPQQTIVQNGS